MIYWISDRWLMGKKWVRLNLSFPKNLTLGLLGNVIQNLTVVHSADWSSQMTFNIRAQRSKVDPPTMHQLRVEQRSAQEIKELAERIRKHQTNPIINNPFSSHSQLAHRLHSRWYLLFIIHTKNHTSLCNLHASKLIWFLVDFLYGTPQKIPLGERETNALCGSSTSRQATSHKPRATGGLFLDLMRLFLCSLIWFNIFLKWDKSFK
jgi:hypothetical protein